MAQRHLRQQASRKGQRLRPETLEYAQYVIVFTTFPAARFSAPDVLEWYRTRWQVELVFKRFKSLAGLAPSTLPQPPLLRPPLSEGCMINSFPLPPLGLPSGSSVHWKGLSFSDRH